MKVRINHVAVWILIVVYFLIGWAWYAIWGDTWLNLHAKTATDIERTHNVGAYVLAFVASIVVNYTLAVLIARTNPESVWCGLKVAHLSSWSTRQFPCFPLSKRIPGRSFASTWVGHCSAWRSADTSSAAGGDVTSNPVS
jgi:hypothetical protein